jgi:RNAse (barnase) inhibitor barstar
MNFIDLDAHQWKTALDFYEALLSALGAPRWHGRNINALIDSMIYGGINEIEPPLTIRITGTENLPADARDELAFTVLAFGEHQGTDQTVLFQGSI